MISKEETCIYEKYLEKVGISEQKEKEQILIFLYKYAVFVHELMKN